MQRLHSYFKHTGKLFFGSALFVASCIIIRASCETKNQEEKIELQKKVHRTICVRDITLLAARSSFYVIFCWFLHLLPPASQVTYLLNGPYKDIVLRWWHSVWWYYEWTVENMKISCNLILTGWHLQEHDII